MARWILLAAAVVAAVMIIRIALADSPGTLTNVNGLLTYTGKALFVENSARYDATSADWTFETDSYKTSRNPLDHDDGMVIRNVNTTDGNQSLLCFESVSTTGERFRGACWGVTYLQHDGVESDHPTRMDLYLAKQGKHGGWIRQAVTFMWDDLQGGLAIGLGVEPVRQGINLWARTPLVWLDDTGGTVASWKYGDALNTLQIGDGHDSYTGGGVYTIQAPRIGLNAVDMAGSTLALRGGDSSGAGVGGSVCLDVATAGAPGTTVNVPRCRAELSGDALPAWRPVNGPATLGDARYPWNGMYMGAGADVYREGDAQGLYAQLQAALERIKVLEAGARTQAVNTP